MRIKTPSLEAKPLDMTVTMEGRTDLGLDVFVLVTSRDEVVAGGRMTFAYICDRMEGHPSRMLAMSFTRLFGLENRRGAIEEAGNAALDLLNATYLDALERERDN